MRWPLVMLLALTALPAAAETIGQVLDRSQQTRLAAMEAADPDGPQARILRQSFDTLVQALKLTRPVELRIVRGEVIGQTLLGKVVVVSESLARLPEPDRLFVLAHEIGHVALDHWAEMHALYRIWEPGEVVKRDADAMSGALLREASRLSHQQEYQADAFALTILRSLGRPDSDVLATFQHLGTRMDTATHPGTYRRLAALRDVMKLGTVAVRTRSGQ